MKIKKLHPDALLPKYSSDGASAFDLFCYENVEWKLEENIWTAVIKTGWAFEIEKEYGMFILSRSGHGFKALTHLANCVGLLDFDYRGEAMVKLVCLKSSPPVLEAGIAVAQVCVIETPRQYFDVVEELSETERGTNGFGSTDKNRDKK